VQAAPVWLCGTEAPLVFSSNPNSPASLQGNHPTNDGRHGRNLTRLDERDSVVAGVSETSKQAPTGCRSRREGDRPKRTESGTQLARQRETELDLRHSRANCVNVWLSPLLSCQGRRRGRLWFAGRRRGRRCCPAASGLQMPRRQPQAHRWPSPRRSRRRESSVPRRRKPSDGAAGRRPGRMRFCAVTDGGQ